MPPPPLGPPPRRSWGAPGSPPSPDPLTSTAPLHAPAPGRPSSPQARRRSSLPRAAIPGSPVDSGPPLRRFSQPGPAGPNPERCSGRGRRVTAPGRGHAQAPGVTRPAGRTLEATSGTPFPPSEERSPHRLGLGRFGSTVAGHPLYLGPGASSWSLFEHKGPAPRQPPFPLRSSSRCLTPRHTLRLQSPEEGGWGCTNTTSLGPASWHKSGPTLVGACPTPSRLQKARYQVCGGGATWRRSENTATPKLGGYPSPQCCSLSRRQPSSSAVLCSPTTPSRLIC